MILSRKLCKTMEAFLEDGILWVRWVVERGHNRGVKA